MIDLKLLIKNGVHYGHQKSRWSPKMAPYIWGYRNNIHLIDVSKTASQLAKAAKFLESVASEGKDILFVGTKKAARDIVYRLAKELKLPYASNRWIGGTFTNFRQVRKSVSNLLHYEDILERSKEFNYNKKELNLFQKRAERLENSVGGIRKLSWPIGAVVVVDVKKESVCVQEANNSGIPVVGLVDTNSDPSNIDYVIPCNDDSSKSIEILMNYLADFVKKGQEVAAKKPKDKDKKEVSSDKDVKLEADDDSGEEDKPKKKVSKSKSAAVKDTKKTTKPKAKTATKKSKEDEDKSDKEVKEAVKPKSKAKVKTTTSSAKKKTSSAKKDKE